MDIAQFRLDFPEFSDVNKYTDAQINFYSGLAANIVSSVRFGNNYNYALELYVAFNLALAQQNATGQGGPVNSKSVGSVSISYNTNTASEIGAGVYDSNNYGKLFYRLIKLYGTGCYNANGNAYYPDNYGYYGYLG